MSRAVCFCWVCWVLCSAGCASAPRTAFGPRPAAETAERIPFLRDGVTSRAEIAARLGAAVAEFEAGRIWVYLFQGTQSGGVRQCESGENGVVGQPVDFTVPELRYELVLTFGADDRLVRHTLVEKPGMNLP